MLDAEFNSESNGAIFAGGRPAKNGVSVEKLVLEVFLQHIRSTDNIYCKTPFFAGQPPVKMASFDSELNSASSTIH